VTLERSRPVVEEPQTLRREFVDPGYLVSDHSFLARTATFFGRPMLQGIEGAVLSDGEHHKDYNLPFAELIDAARPIFAPESESSILKRAVNFAP
jgi:hypothetical protein